MNMDWREAEITLPNGQVLVMNAKVLNDVLTVDVALVTPGVGTRTVAGAQGAVKDFTGREAV